MPEIKKNPAAADHALATPRMRRRGNLWEVMFLMQGMPGGCGVALTADLLQQCLKSPHPLRMFGSDVVLSGEVGLEMVEFDRALRAGRVAVAPFPVPAPAADVAGFRIDEKPFAITDRAAFNGSVFESMRDTALKWEHASEARSPGPAPPRFWMLSEPAESNPARRISLGVRPSAPQG